MPIEADPTTAEGNHAWGCRLLEENRLADAANAFAVASKLDPLNPERYFDHAEVLVQMAEAESPFFRDPMWAQAQKVVERGGQLDRQNPRGVAIYEQILQARVNDRDTTTDTTPNRMLAKGATPSLEVRPTTEIRPISAAPAMAAHLFWIYWITGGAILSLAVISIRALISGFNSIVSWSSVLLVVATMAAAALVIRLIFADRLADRRDQVSW